MGAAGKAFTFVTNEQGDELTKVENLINLQIPQATVDGFSPTPPPSDWIDQRPSSEPGKPGVSRFDVRYGSKTGDAPSTVTLPPRTLGSKIPITRRHRRRR